MIVKTGTTASGVRYAIDDSLAVRHGTDDAERIENEQCKVAYQILVRYAEKCKGVDDEKRISNSLW